MGHVVISVKNHPSVRPQLRSCANEAFSFKTPGGTVDYQTDANCKLTEIVFTWQDIKPHRSHYLLNQTVESFEQTESDKLVIRTYHAKADSPVIASHQLQFENYFIELREQTQREIHYFETGWRPWANRTVNATLSFPGQIYETVSGRVFAQPASK